ncbi:MAG: hypothetical protein ACOY0S_00840 [Patescibacteria group bacterium]
MDKVWQIIRRKPLFFLIASLAYLAVVVFLKWRLGLTFPALLFVSGGVAGIYFLDIAEVVFGISPSPFRSIVFAAPFALVSFFVVTSSGSFLGSGLTLTLYLTLVLWQLGEWKIRGNLMSWYRLVAGPVTVKVQRWLLFLFIAVFMIETYLFVR